MKYFIRYKNVLYLLLRSNVCKVVSPLWRLAGGGGAELSSVIYYFSFRFFVGSFQSIGARCEKTLFVPPFVWLSFTTQHSATQNHNVTKIIFCNKPFFCTICRVVMDGKIMIVQSPLALPLESFRILCYG